MAPELTDVGREQAAAAAERVAELLDARATRVVSSDQTRARQTADVVAARLGVDVETDARLREQSLGVLEGRLIDELEAQPVPDGSHITEISWGEGGESIADVHARLTVLVADLRADPGADAVVLVSHGDTLRVLLAVLAGVGHRDVDWVPIGNGEVLARELGR